MDKLKAIGLAGRLFACAELVRRNCTILSDIFNLSKSDVLIETPTNKQITLKIRTRSSNLKKWVLSNKDEEVYADDIYYVFVLLNKLANPSFYIVSSKTVSKITYENHKKWVDSRPKDAPISNVRKFRFEDDLLFENKWESMF